MKNLILSAALALFTALSVNAQGTFKLGVNGNYVENGTVIHYFGTPKASTLKVYLQLTNTTAADVNVKGTVIVKDKPFGDGLEVSWCAFDKCVSGDIDDAVLPANNTEGLNGLTYASVISGDNPFPTSEFTFRFAVAENSSDSVDVTVRFIDRATDTNAYATDTMIYVSGGISGAVPGWSDPASTKKFVATPKIDVYPNPSTDMVHFDMGDETGTIIVYSSTGAIVRKVKSAKGLVTIDVKNLPAGMYVYRIENAPQITGKFLVK